MNYKLWASSFLLHAVNCACANGKTMPISISNTEMHEICIVYARWYVCECEMALSCMRLGSVKFQLLAWLQKFSGARLHVCLSSQIKVCY